MGSVGLGGRGYSVQWALVVVEQPASRTLACLFIYVCLNILAMQPSLALNFLLVYVFAVVCIMYMECRGKPQGSVLAFHLQMGSLFFLWNTRPDGLSAPGILLSLHPISLEGCCALISDASVPCLVFMWVLKILIWLLMLQCQVLLPSKPFPQP